MGAAEEIMGTAIKELQAEDPELWRRSDLVLTTKIFWGGDGVNERGLSRKHLNEGLQPPCSACSLTMSTSSSATGRTRTRRPRLSCAA